MRNVSATSQHNFCLVHHHSFYVLIYQKIFYQVHFISEFLFGSSNILLSTLWDPTGSPQICTILSAPLYYLLKYIFVYSIMRNDICKSCAGRRSQWRKKERKQHGVRNNYTIVYRLIAWNYPANCCLQLACKSRLILCLVLVKKI